MSVGWFVSFCKPIGALFYNFCHERAKMASLLTLSVLLSLHRHSFDVCWHGNVKTNGTEHHLFRIRIMKRWRR
jgi:hypothetical protein